MITHFFDNCRRGFPLQQLHRAKTPLPSNDFVLSGFVFPNYDRLEQAVFVNRLGQFLDAFLIKDLAGLITVRNNLVELDLYDLLLAVITVALPKVK